MSEKLHQHLAAKKNVEQGYEKTKAETFKVFKSDKMDGLQKDYEPFDDDGQQVPSESKELVTTVPERMAHFSFYASKLIDFRATSDVTNCEAVAKLEFHDHNFGELPATALLALEKSVEEFRGVLDRIPTRDMTKKWRESACDHVYIHGPVETYKHTKQTSAVTLYDATVEHPAQIKEVVEDKQVGKFSTNYFTGAISAQTKSNCLARADEMLVAIKKARMKANETEIVPVCIGAKLIEAICADWDD